VRTKSGAFQWQKHHANEALDCRVYSRAALWVGGVARWNPSKWAEVRARNGLDGAGQPGVRHVQPAKVTVARLPDIPPVNDSVVTPVEQPAEQQAPQVAPPQAPQQPANDNGVRRVAARPVRRVVRSNYMG